MKKCSLIAALLAFCAVPAASYALDGQANATVTVYPASLSVNTDSNLSFSVNREDNKTVYIDAEFLSSSPAQIKIGADAGQQVAYVVPTSLALTKAGGAAATVEMVCRMKADVYPTSKTDGEACGTGKTVTETKKLNLALFPVQVTFPDGFGSGDYSSTLTMSVNYQ